MRVNAAQREAFTHAMPEARASELPDDPKQLKLLVLRMRAELVEAQLELQRARLELALHKRPKFGASLERLHELDQLQPLVEQLEVAQSGNCTKKIEGCRQRGGAREHD